MNASLLLSQALAQGPYLLFFLLGAVVAIVNWQRCPTPSLLVVLAMLDLACVRIFSVATGLLIYPLILEKMRLPAQQFSLVVSAIGFLITAATILGYILLLAAAFIGRPNLPQPQYGQFPKM